MKFIPTAFTNGLAEIGQQLQIKVAFLNKTKDGHYTNAHIFVLCRDFLGDTLDAIEKKRTNTIYGFTFNPKKQQIIQNQTKLVWKFPNEKTRKNFLANLPSLHAIESANKCRKTTARAVTIGKDLYIITTGSSFWLKSIFNISLYTFILKSLGYDLIRDLPLFHAIAKTTVVGKHWDNTEYERKTNEAEYANSVLNKIDLVLQNLKKINLRNKTVSGVVGDASISEVHNRCGFVSIISDIYGDNVFSVRIKKLSDGG
jgi:hypothetical protein